MPIEKTKNIDRIFKIPDSWENSKPKTKEERNRYFKKIYERQKANINMGAAIIFGILVANLYNYFYKENWWIPILVYSLVFFTPFVFLILLEYFSYTKLFSKMTNMLFKYLER